MKTKKVILDSVNYRDSFSFTVFSIGLIQLFIINLFNILFLIRELPIPSILRIIPWALFVFCTTISLLLSKSLFPSKHQIISSQLKDIIYTNHWYKSIDENGMEKIITSAYFKYRFDNDKLFLSFFPNGLPISNQMNEIQAILETLLNMYVEEIDNSKPNHTLYILSKDNGGKRIDVSQKW